MLPRGFVPGIARGAGALGLLLCLGAPALAGTASQPEAQMQETERSGFSSVSAGATPYLLIHTTSVMTSVRRALNELGIVYDVFSTYGGDIYALDLSPYSEVFVAMDGGLLAQADVAHLAAWAAGGGTLHFLGGTCWQPFALGVNDYLLANYVYNYCWTVVYGAPDVAVTDPSHYLAADIPATYDFLELSASYYQIRQNDPSAEIAAMNADGWACLLSKGIGAGHFDWFINSVYEWYWQHPADYAVLKQIIANMLAGSGLRAIPESIRQGLEPGASVQRGETLQNSLDFDVIIGSIRSSQPWLQIDLPFAGGPVDTLAPDSSMAFGITLDATALGVGAYSDTIKVLYLRQLRASDQGEPGGPVPDTLRIPVTLGVTHPPQITGPAAVNATECQTLVFDAIATDPDEDPLTWFAVDLPEGASIDPQSGAVTWPDIEIPPVDAIVPLTYGVSDGFFADTASTAVNLREIRSLGNLVNFDLFPDGVPVPDNPYGGGEITGDEWLGEHVRFAALPFPWSNEAVLNIVGDSEYYPTPSPPNAVTVTQDSFSAYGYGILDITFPTGMRGIGTVDFVGGVIVGSYDARAGGGAGTDGGGVHIRVMDAAGKVLTDFYPYPFPDPEPFCAVFPGQIARVQVEFSNYAALDDFFFGELGLIPSVAAIHQGLEPGGSATTEITLRNSFDDPVIVQEITATEPWLELDVAAAAGALPDTLDPDETLAFGVTLDAATLPVGVYQDIITVPFVILAPPILGEFVPDTLRIPVTLGVTHAPVIAAPALLHATDCQSLDFSPAATDPDDDSLTWFPVDLPDGASIDPQSGEVFWESVVVPAGGALIPFTYGVTDGFLADSATTLVDVLELRSLGNVVNFDQFPDGAPVPDDPYGGGEIDGSEWEELGVRFEALPLDWKGGKYDAFFNVVGEAEYHLPLSPPNALAVVPYIIESYSYGILDITFPPAGARGGVGTVDFIGGWIGGQDGGGRAGGTDEAGFIAGVAILDASGELIDKFVINSYSESFCRLYPGRIARVQVYFGGYYVALDDFYFGNIRLNPSVAELHEVLEPGGTSSTELTLTNGFVSPVIVQEVAATQPWIGFDIPLAGALPDTLESGEELTLGITFDATKLPAAVYGDTITVPFLIESPAAPGEFSPDTLRVPVTLVVTHAPHITGPALVHATECTRLDFFAVADEEDADPLTWFALDLPEGASIDPVTAEILWETVEIPVGDALIPFTYGVTDGFLADSATTMVDVLELRALGNVVTFDQFPDGAPVPDDPNGGGEVDGSEWEEVGVRFEAVPFGGEGGMTAFLDIVGEAEGHLPVSPPNALAVVEALEGGPSYGTIEVTFPPPAADGGAGTVDFIGGWITGFYGAGRAGAGESERSSVYAVLFDADGDVIDEFSIYPYPSSFCRIHAGRIARVQLHFSGVDLALDDFYFGRVGLNASVDMLHDVLEPGETSSTEITVSNRFVSPVILQEVTAAQPWVHLGVPLAGALPDTLESGDSFSFSVTLDATALPAGVYEDTITLPYLAAAQPAARAGGNPPDALGGLIADTLRVPVTLAVTHAPEITGPATVEATECTSLAFFATAVDEDADPLTWFEVDLPDGASIDPATGEISWQDIDIPGEDAIVQLTYGVSDGLLADTASTAVSVREIRDTGTRVNFDEFPGGGPVPNDPDGGAEITGQEWLVLGVRFTPLSFSEGGPAVLNVVGPSENHLPRSAPNALMVTESPGDPWAYGTLDITFPEPGAAAGLGTVDFVGGWITGASDEMRAGAGREEIQSGVYVQVLDASLVELAAFSVYPYPGPFCAAFPGKIARVRVTVYGYYNALDDFFFGHLGLSSSVDALRQGVEPGNTESTHLTVRNPSGGPVLVQGIGATQPWLDLDAPLSGALPDTLQPGDSLVVGVAFDATALAVGVYEDAITVPFLDDFGADTLRVAVTLGVTHRPDVGGPVAIEGTECRPVAFTVAASDPDEDALTYRLVDGPEGAGAELDEETGEFLWESPRVPDARYAPLVFAIEASDGFFADTVRTVIHVLEARSIATLVDFETTAAGNPIVGDHAGGGEIAGDEWLSQGVRFAAVPIDDGEERGGIAVLNIVGDDWYYTPLSPPNCLTVCPDSATSWAYGILDITFPAAGGDGLHPVDFVGGWIAPNYEYARAPGGAPPASGYTVSLRVMTATDSVLAEAHISPYPDGEDFCFAYPGEIARVQVGFNSSAALDDFWFGSFAPRITLGVLQNPVLTNQIDVIATPNISLEGPPVVTAGSAELEVETIGNGPPAIYRARHLLEGSGVVTLSASAMSALGRAATGMLEFTSFPVAREGGVMASPDGRLEVAVPAGAVNQRVYLTIQGPRFGAETDYEIGPAGLEVPGMEARFHAPGESARAPGETARAVGAPARAAGWDPARSSVWLKRGDAWEEVPSFYDRETGMLVARPPVAGALEVRPRATGETPVLLRSVGLAQNAPNPFAPETWIAFELARPAQVTLRVFDVRGRAVRSLAEGILEAGLHRVRWDGRDAQGDRSPPGVYFYRLQTPDKSLTRRMVLLP